MSAAVDLITDRVRERVRREGVDLAADFDFADRFGARRGAQFRGPANRDLLAFETAR